MNVTTAFSANGLEDQATLPPTNPISIQLGATPLEPEESVHFSLGLVADWADDLQMTIDYFNIQLDDRLSTTSAIPLTDDDIQALLSQGVLDATSYASAKYFTNDFDTTTQGIDFVVNYEQDLFAGSAIFSLAYNWTDTSVDRVTEYRREDEDGNVFYETNLTPQRIRMIEDNLPAHRATLSWSQVNGDFRSLFKVNYYGDFYEDHLDASAGLDIEGSDEITLDWELGYRITESFELAGGAKNLLDNQPSANPFASVVGAKYPPTSPMGINGGFYYLRGSLFFN